MPELKITTLRALSDPSCDDKNVCPGRHKIDGVPGSFVVLKEVGDPAHAAALARYVGAGEMLGWSPDELFHPYEEG